MARGALVRLQARDGSRTSDNEPSLACRASASISGCVRKFLLRLRPFAYLISDHRLVAAENTCRRLAFARPFNAHHACAARPKALVHLGAFEAHGNCSVVDQQTKIC